MSVFDELRPDAPKTPIKDHDLILDGRQLKVREVAEIVGISKERVGHMFHEI